ncbi:MAG: S41 family peptidase [Bacteroidales bacterium]|nr:S41 family peptidase [Bacteroidales bacterium]MBN2758171.1 S41 family peptidase [Bacteroidales bacterium]
MKKFKILNFWRTILIAVTISSFSILFIAFDDSDDFELAKNLDIYHTLIRDLRMIYVDEIDVSKLVKTSIDEMLKSLDPYTVYYPESEIEDFRFMTTGQYGGIGALIRNSEQGVVVEEVYQNYPADKAGIMPGDIFKKVGDKLITPKDEDDISLLLKGIPNSDIEITIFRPIENKEYVKTVKREKIIVKNVPYYTIINQDVAYIKLNGFTQTAYSEVKDALLDLKEKGANKLILDLRSNPGGLLDEAVKIVSLFVNKETLVVSTKGKVKSWNSDLYTNKEPVDINIPIVVLVNRNSASASEIVSGALQDLDRAVIIGQRTYGKGLVQTSRDLSYNTKLKVTTAKYYIPSGRCIQALDYTHRNKDGSVGYIPDSLISEFKTINGRKVFDGGGIIPDIKVETQTLCSVGEYLLSNYIVFDYVTKFKHEKQKIESIDKFTIQDSDYEGFVKYVKDRNIEYKTESDIALNNFIKTLKEDNYYNKVEDEIKTLQNKLKHNVEDDLYYFKDNIKTYLSAEIINRYYYQNGSIEYMLLNSVEKEKAIKILNNTQEYKKILNVK